MKLKIAVVQFKIAHLDPEKNLKRAENFIKKAKNKKAEVIVFPEDCLTGSIGDTLTGIKGNYEKWLDVSQKNKKAWQKLAAKYQIDVVTGSIMEKIKGHKYNTSYYINAKGKVLGTYHKNHLYKSERDMLEPDTKIPVFKTAWGKVGIIICWDIMYPEIFQRLVKAGAQIIFCPSYWWTGISESTEKYNHREQEKLIDALCVTRALETDSIFVYTNAAGTMRYKNGTKDVLIGHSQITMPILETVKKLNHNREKMFIQEVDLSLLKKAERVFESRTNLLNKKPL
ncbi:MAG: carbon-nitrogen hydrolase family protein [Candidatus Uhrbacteria bacterium]